MKSLVRKWLIGDTVFSEYSKITAADDLAQRVWLWNNNSISEISNNHWLLCIEPIMYGIWLEKKELAEYDKKNKFIIYVGGTIGPDKKRVHKPEATLTLDLFDRIEDPHGELLVLRLQKTVLSQLSWIKRYLIYFRYYRKDRLTYSRFKAFVSAYSYPRRVRVVTFRKEDYYNIFPMDLLGGIDNHKKYVFGLRHTNIALKMILDTRKLVVAEVSHEFKNTVYALGKHHSGNPPAIDKLDFKVRESSKYGFYIPEWVESYQEVNIMQTINMGSHMLLWGEKAGEQRFTQPRQHMFLVHFLHYIHQKHLGYLYQLVE